MKTLTELYEAYFKAERAWEAELRATFGYCGGTERYVAEARGAPDTALRAACRAHREAAAEYFAAYRATL